MKNKVTQLGSVLTLSLILSACATATKSTSDETNPQGAWASGLDVASCDTAPITYFSSDGVVLVLLTSNGPIHSFGRWSVENGTIEMTHNDFPVQGDGSSKAPVSLDILTLTDERFDTRNPAGQVRERIKCSDIELTPSPDHASHD